MLVSFNPVISNNKSNRKSPNFKSLQNGLIELSDAKQYGKAKLFLGVIKAGGYTPTTSTYDKNIATLNQAKSSVIDDEIKEFLTEAAQALEKKARELGIIR